MAAPRPEPHLLTAGRIASTLREPVHKVQYVLRTRAHIRPVARAGTLRLYGADTLAQVRHELAAIAARRTPQGGCHG